MSLARSSVTVTVRHGITNYSFDMVCYGVSMADALVVGEGYNFGGLLCEKLECRGFSTFRSGGPWYFTMFDIKETKRFS